MKNLLTVLVDLGFEAYKAKKSVKKVLEEVEPYIDKMRSIEGLTVEEFFEAYEIRLYDIENKAEDIKFLKKYDREGVYLLHNHDKNCYFIGESKHIFQKINKHFKGQGNSAVYKDWKNGQYFTIQIILLSDTECETINDLKNEIKQRYIPYIF